jgi:hypothetical protein
MARNKKRDANENDVYPSINEGTAGFGFFQEFSSSREDEDKEIDLDEEQVEYYEPAP